MNSELLEKGYVTARGLLGTSVARLIYKTLLLRYWRGECRRDGYSPTVASVSNAAETDALLLELRPKIEAITGCRLVPTHSFAQLYFHGDSLLRHHDRGSGKVCVSIHLGRDGGEGSLSFRPNDKVMMEDGDGAIYLGCETGHWRERFTGNTTGQMILHYVISSGPHGQHYIDSHPEKLPPSVSREPAIVRADYHVRLKVSSDIVAHLAELHEHACRPEVPVIIELGVRTGQSTAAFLAALEVKGAGHLWSVDIAEPRVPEHWRRLDRWHLRIGHDLDPGVLDWAPQQCDVLFIDTSHDYEHTLAELRAYVPRVRPGGVVLCHDTELMQPLPQEVGYRPQPPYPVLNALQTYCTESGMDWENRPGCSGLGVIQIPELSG
jgi:predicted O-methyltransferase YrrM